MRLREMVRRGDAELQISEASGDLERTASCLDRLVQLPEQRVDGRSMATGLASTRVVHQLVGKSLGVEQAPQCLPDLTELQQHRPKLEPDIEGLLQRRWALRQGFDRDERLLEPFPAIRQR